MTAKCAYDRGGTAGMTASVPAMQSRGVAGSRGCGLRPPQRLHLVGVEAARAAVGNAVTLSLHVCVLALHGVKAKMLRSCHYLLVLS